MLNMCDIKDTKYVLYIEKVSIEDDMPKVNFMMGLVKEICEDKVILEDGEVPHNRIRMYFGADHKQIENPDVMDYVTEQFKRLKNK